MTDKLEELKAHLNSRKKNKEFEGKAVYHSTEFCPKGTKLRIGRKTHRVKNDSHLVLIDESPGAFFRHPVSYELHETGSGNVIRFTEMRWLNPSQDHPPMEMHHSPVHVPVSHTEGITSKKFSRDDELVCNFSSGAFDVPTPDSGHRYAILCGGMDDYFKYDVANMRDVLFHKYAFSDENMFILFNDGKPTDSPRLDPDFPCSRNALDNLLFSFAAGGERELGKDDTLFIYIFSHGGHCGGNSFFATYGGTGDNPHDQRFYYDFELAAQAAKIQCKELIVLLNACESGAFRSKIITAVSNSSNGPGKTVVFTSSTSRQLSWTFDLTKTGLDDMNHAAFSVFFYSALNWGFPFSNLNQIPKYIHKNCRPSVRHGQLFSIGDAYRWAKHMMKSFRITSIFGIELPQSLEHPAPCSDSIYMGNPKLLIRDEDINFMENALPPDQEPSTDPTDKNYWSKQYKAGQENPIVARVFNIGNAPSYNIYIEFSLTTLDQSYFLTSGEIETIAPGHHAYVSAQFECPSILSIYQIISIDVKVSYPVESISEGTENTMEIISHTASLNQPESIQTIQKSIAEKNTFLPVNTVIKNIQQFGVTVKQFRNYREIFQPAQDHTRAQSSLLGSIIRDDTNRLIGLKGGVKLTCPQKPDINLTAPIIPHGRFAFNKLECGTYILSVTLEQGSLEEEIQIPENMVLAKVFVLTIHEAYKSQSSESQSSENLSSESQSSE